jgi:methylmalonyl-CoA mutase
MASSHSNSSETLYNQWIQRVQQELSHPSSIHTKKWETACFFASTHTSFVEELIHKQLSNTRKSNDFLSLRYSPLHPDKESILDLKNYLQYGVQEIVLLQENFQSKELRDLVVNAIPPAQQRWFSFSAIPESTRKDSGIGTSICVRFSNNTSDLLAHFHALRDQLRPEDEFWVEVEATAHVIALLQLLKALRALYPNPIAVRILIGNQELGKALVEATVLSAVSILGDADALEYCFPSLMPFSDRWYFLSIPAVLRHEGGLDGKHLLKGNWMLQHQVAQVARLKPPKYALKGPKVFPHVQSAPGSLPYLRGPYASMYLGKPWTIRQYAGFSTAEESNAFYKKNLAAGQTGLSIAFDLPTHRGYDSDHVRVKGDVGMAGVAIDSVEDMKMLLEGIDLSSISVSMTMNGAVFPILAFYLVAAEEQGASLASLSGTIQNDILKEFLVRNTYIYPPKASMRLITDIFRFTSSHMPKFNPISISGYHMHEAGATAAQELAFTIADGLEYVKAGIKAGIAVDQFAPRLSFFWGIGMHFFTEVAKLRAARLIWAEQMQRFKPEKERSCMLRAHCQTSGWSLGAKSPMVNIARTTLEAMSAVFGHTQSLHTNSFDEALALPTDESAAIARYTQLYLQQCGICEVVDPMAGTEIIEQRTQELIEDTRMLLSRIEEMGGMTEAVRNGWAKMQIEKEATMRQARIDQGIEIQVGLNAYLPPEEKSITLRSIDQTAVQKDQCQKLEKLRNTRNSEAVKKCLERLSKAAAKEDEPLFELCLEAARNRATVGEISAALESAFGRYEPQYTMLSGVYRKAMSNDMNMEKARTLCEEFSRLEGRRPRILVAKLGQDGHDRGAHLVATAFADMGFDVDLGPMFSTPSEIAKQAMENDVHLIGVSSMTGAHKVLIPELIEELKRLGLPEIVIIAGGIIPEEDAIELKRAGVFEVFGPGTILADAAVEIIQTLLSGASH